MQIRWFAILLIICFAQVTTASGAMIHQWTFNGEAGSDTVIDLIGGANGTIHGGATLDGTGKVVLDGVNDYVDLPNGLFSSMTFGTFEAWVTWDQLVGSGWQRIFDFGTTNLGEDPPLNASYSGAGTDHFVLGFLGTTQTAFTIVRDEGVAISNFGISPLVTPFDIETYFAVTYGTNQVTLFMNGLQVASSPISPVTPLSTLTNVNNWLGRSQFSNDGLFAGTFNEFRIYDTVLNASQISTNFATGPTSSFSAVPEPSSMVLFGTSILGLLGHSWRKKRDSRKYSSRRTSLA